MQGSYSPWLVAFSFLMAFAASYTALEMSRCVYHSRGGAARAWLGGGAISTGIGIWTMHFIGMFAVSLPMTFDFHIGKTLLSLTLGIVVSAFALYVASRAKTGVIRILAGGMIFGAGLTAMHYVGLAAIKRYASISYDRAGLGFTVLVTVATACAALWIISALSRSRNRYLSLIKIVAALIMGAGMFVLQFMDLAVVDFILHSGGTNMEGSHNASWLASTIGTMALLIIGVTHLTILFDRRLRLQQRQRNKAMQEKVQLSDALDDSSNEIYFFDSESHRFVKVNRGALDNLGYTADEILAMTPLDILPDSDVASFNKLLRPLRDGLQKELLIETRHRRKDGTEYPVQVHGQLSNITDPPIFVAIVTDITQRKALETQLMQANKMQSIGQLAAGIAHEINTPAQFVGDNTRFVQDAFKDLIDLNNSFATLYSAARENAITPELLDDVAASMKAADVDFLTDEVPSAIDQSLDGISRISNIVRAMKEFSHPGGKDFEAVDLNSAISNTITVASNEWKYVADVETDFDNALPPVMCYQQEINQVILNLIVNAAHAIEAGQTGSSDEKGVIRISTRASDTVVEIALSDSGCGIPDDVKDRIFEPFFTTKEVGKGTGQGLAMAYSTIVDRHLGKLLVDSTPGKGTTFTIRLPLNRPDTITDGEAA